MIYSFLFNHEGLAGLMLADAGETAVPRQPLSWSSWSYYYRAEDSNRLERWSYDERNTIRVVRVGMEVW